MPECPTSPSDAAAPAAAGATPRVSIGLPVYNGERFLERAIRSVLTQTLQDLELVIGDNASSDGTERIARAAAAADPRVRYIRHPRNLGAAPNYNHTLAAARAPYFKWLAHDDAMEPSFLEQAVAALEAQPHAPLCQAQVRFIDAEDRPIAVHDGLGDGTGAASPSARFAAMVLRSHPCTAIFGVFRTEVLRASLQHASFHGADRALLAQLALRGPFLRLEAPLVLVREHDGRYTRRVADAEQRRLWHDTSARRHSRLPTLRLYREYWGMAMTEPLPPAERLRAMAILAAWWWHNWNAARVAVDVLALLAPSLVGLAERTKTRLFGAAPGHFVEPRR
jgi:glycosyltransferase involved in cell wall biosynthesis